ncbi:hypothetical protein C818_00661 [Lachnospiraceae bacterium MD308]|nr:hypothetical protein C818_00661 [Lachnospiraceae bacterium MD308]
MGNCQMAKILLLEDDESLNRGISLKLEKEGYEVLSAVGVKQAERLLSEHEVALVISDITVEDGDGLSFCKNVRKKSQVHFIFLTALDQEVDIVNGYDAGADDYITKPFSLMVLMSKVNALMRRIGEKDGDVAGQFLRSGDLEVNCREMKAYKGGEEIFLSKREFQLLLYFMENPRQIISKEQILSGVWDVDGQFVDDNTVPVTISRLKKKAAGSGRAEYIKNVRGMGYIWTEDVR